MIIYIYLGIFALQKFPDAWGITTVKWAAVSGVTVVVAIQWESVVRWPLDIALVEWERGVVAARG